MLKINRKKHMQKKFPNHLKYKPHVDVKKLSWWLETHEDAIFDKYTDGSLVKTHRFIYRKCPSNNAKILAVAHLDTVQPLTGIVKHEGALVHASGMDDRMGAYLAWDWMPDNGFEVDVLLTDYEEDGASTAEFFGLADNYNWIVEFDREGQDAVTYDLDSLAWLETLENCGFNVRRGSFSDICFLPTVACCVNIGNGMRRSHNINSYVDLRDTVANLQRFSYLYHHYRDTKFIQSMNSNANYMCRSEGDDRTWLENQKDNEALINGIGGWPDGSEPPVKEMTQDEENAERNASMMAMGGVWWKDDENMYHCTSPELVKGPEVVCIDCNSPAMPTEMGELCVPCYKHYHANYGDDVSELFPPF